MDVTWQDRRVWLGGGALIAIVLIAASWFLMIHPKLTAAADLRSQTANTITQNDVLAAKNNGLATEQKNIGGLRSALAKQLHDLPATNNLPLFTDQLTRIATAESVTITSISIGTPAAVAAPVAPVATTTDGTSSPTASSTTATPTTTTTATPTGSTGTAAAATTAATASQYSIAVTVVTSASPARQVAFLKALQHATRPVLVTSTEVTRTASGAAGLTTVTSQANIFTAPMSAAEAAQFARLLHGVK